MAIVIDGNEETRIHSRIEEWKHRLVDGSKRNHLIYWKPGKKTIELVFPDFEVLLKNLFNRQKIYFFSFTEKEEKEFAEKALDKTFLTEQAILSCTGKNNLWVNGNCLSQKNLDAILKNYHTRAKFDFNERGLRTFYLFAGLLHWSDPETKESILSPLILIPVDLYLPRDSGKNLFSIKISEDDVLINPALQAKMLELYRISLEDEADLDSVEDIVAVIEKIQKQFAERGWKVEKRLCAGCFSFHKIVMYNDLKENHALFSSHPVLRGFADCKPLESIKSIEKIDETRLDEITPPKESFQVLDADSSQQLAISYALKGANIVLQGPPGTGKSQTISNLIAEWIATGKKVLFVSEKIAALEVVKKRLQELQLDHYCLELHSHKTNKKTVVQELKRCFDERVSVKETDFRFEELQSLRLALNEYPEILHRGLPLLKKNLYELLGWLSDAENIPDFSEDFTYSEEETDFNQWFTRYPLVFMKVEEIWDSLVQSPVYFWEGLKYAKEPFSIQQKIATKLHSIIESLDETEKVFSPLKKALSWEPASFENCVRFIELIGKLEAMSPLPVEWFTENILAERAEKLADLLIRKEKFLQKALFFRSHFLESFFEDAVIESLPTVPSEALSMSTSNLEELCTQLTLLREELEKAILPIFDLFRSQNTEPRAFPYLFLEIHLAVMNWIAEGIELPSLKWLLQPALFEEIRKEFDPLREQLAKCFTLRQKLLTKYSESLFQIDLEKAFEKKDSIFFLFSEYHKQLKNCTLKGQLPKEWKEDVRDALYVRRLTPQIFDLLKRTLPSFEFEKESSDKTTEAQAMVSAQKALGIVQRTQDAISKKEWYSALVLILSKVKIEPSFLLEIRKISKAFQMSNNTLQRIHTISGIDFHSQFLSQSYERILETIRKYEKPFYYLLPFFQRCTALVLPGKKLAMEPLSEFLQILADYRETKRYSAQGKNELDGLSIEEGKSLLKKMRETLLILEGFKNLQIAKDAVLKFSQPEFNTLIFPKSDVQRATTSLQLLEKRQKELLCFFDDQRCKWVKIFCKEVSFSSQRDWIVKLEKHLPMISSWMRYEITLQEESGSPITRFLEMALTKRIPTLYLENALLKTVYKKVIQKAWEKEESLQSFSRDFREKQIEEFRQMDRRSLLANKSRVLQKAFERVPTENYSGSEVGVLIAQSEKKRNILPIRKLFEKIPELLLSLKPCLMMSPLSVCQFINPEKTLFDAVVFDEASQIFTEDAIGALCRAKQYIIVGDSKQLPPTDFFKSIDRSFEEPGEQAGLVVSCSSEEIDTDASANYDSVLEEIQKLPDLRILRLNWHYRSKSESLISFSNKNFYEDQLITFPEPYHKNDELGVKLVYCPEAMYDRGKTRKNEKEATEVVKLILEHFSEHPSKSLGVIALSEPQMEAIQEQFDKQLIRNPKYRTFITEDRLQGFFIKNLENVQGDERDVIILSIGYGKDATGKLNLNFGPINQQGGERRLNVAITRAKEKMIVVTSISSVQIGSSPSQSVGLNTLKGYLAYVEVEGEHFPNDILLNRVVSSQKEEKYTIENSVRKVLEEWGYRVRQNLGKGTFRLDLAVVHPSIEGAFILGIECDGPNYHLSKTARDRDRLRQETLNKLGWKTYRIWSPCWVRNTIQEKENLKKALENALSDRTQTVDSLKRVLTVFQPENAKVLPLSL